jgi:hypothetical protein
VTVVCWQVWTDITQQTAVATNKGCHDVGLRIQHLGYHNSWDCWCFMLLYGFVCCTVLVLAVLTDGRWKLAATCCNTISCQHMAQCCRQTQDVLHPAECPRSLVQQCKHQSDSGQQVSSLPHIALDVAAVCLLKCGLCNTISHRGLAVGPLQPISVPYDTLNHVTLSNFHAGQCFMSQRFLINVV